MKHFDIAIKPFLRLPIGAAIVKAFQLDATIGSMATGKKANMLLLTKNPLEEIETCNTIEKIIIEGAVIERSELAVPRIK